jgi:hypothetical protein
MSPQHDHPIVLSVQRAFVVHFTADSRMATGHVVGRVEHVVSGQVTRFESLEVLLAFFDRVLNERRCDTPDTNP